MTKHARIILTEEDSALLEVITYDPVGVINEAFLSEFIECPEEVERGYRYNSKTKTFYLPEGYAKHPDFEVFGYVPIPEDVTVDENGFIVFPPPPKFVIINETDFRSALNLTEKILWDDPETGTTEQKAVINTLKMEFPYYGVESMTDEFTLLEQIIFTTSERITEIKAALA